MLLNVPEVLASNFHITLRSEYELKRDYLTRLGNALAPRIGQIIAGLSSKHAVPC